MKKPPAKAGGFMISDGCCGCRAPLYSMPYAPSNLNRDAGQRRSLPQFTTLAAAGAGPSGTFRFRSRSKIMKGPARVNTAGPFLRIIFDSPGYLTIRETISLTACSTPAKTARDIMLCPMFSSSISDISTIGWTL